MVEIGRGLKPADGMGEILAARDRRTAGMTAPAYALCLDWVRYPEHLQMTARLGDGGGVDGGGEPAEDE